ncbi:MAG: hypothetical protein RIN56_04405 [Sporomusaceae bacterium]|nr:hypothetical protein [Sporomusaceae bacterium]
MEMNNGNSQQLHFRRAKKKGCIIVQPFFCTNNSQAEIIGYGPPAGAASGQSAMP